MANVLITGASGFVGQNLVPTLCNAGHQIRCVVTKDIKVPGSDKTIIANLDSQTDWSEALKDVEVVIHLAAKVHVMNDSSSEISEEYFRINTQATKSLALQAEQSGVRQFIFLSSIKVNGEYTLAGNPFNELSLCNPSDPYGISKKNAEEELIDIGSRLNMSTTILRVPLVYGPNVKANFLKLMQLVNRRIPLPFGKVENKRHFVFVENLTSAIQEVILNPKAMNELFLVSDDVPLSLNTLITLISNELNSKSKLVPFPLFLLKGICRIFNLNKLSTRLLSSLEVDNSKIKSTLGWTPPVATDEAIHKTVSWFKSEFIS